MQLQVSYDPAEDRLLLSLSLDDRNVGFWLTRRLTALLWQVLWQRAGSSVDATVHNTAKEWMLRLNQDRAARALAVSQAPRLQTSAPPLLVTTLQYGPGEKGGHHLSLIDAAGNGERMNLDDDTLYGLIRLLDEALSNSEWNLQLWRPREAGDDVSVLAQPLH